MITFSGLCQYFSEIALYLSTVRFAFVLMGEIQSPWPVAGVFLLGGLVSAFFSRFKGFWAYLPLALIIPAFLMVKSLADVICLLPLAALLFFHIMRRRWTCDAIVLSGSLKAGLVMFSFILLASAVGGKFARLKEEAIPLFVIFLGLVILGLRVLRNEEMGKTGPLFYALNGLVVILVAAAGFVFSNSWLLNTIKAGFKVLYDYILGPLLMGFTYVVIIIPIALGWLLEKLQVKDAEPLEETLQDFMLGDETNELYEEMEIAETSQWVPRILIALGIVFFLFIAFLIIRKMVDYSSARKPSGGNFERTSIGEENVPRRRRTLRNTPADAVRACYRKYLDICGDASVPVDGSIASDEIADRSRHFTGEDATDSLRSLWLPARYAENASTEEDAKQAKQYLKEIKKNTREKQA